LKATAVLLPILGLTWGIGVFAIDTLSLTLAYAFTILNSLQGFFVFVFHCLLNKKIQKAIRKVLKKRSNMNSLPNSNV
jgi:G protein-coupled receptor 133